MSDPYKAVLTGSPGSGKTTSLEYIQNSASDWIECAPEAATILLSSGFPAPNKDFPWTPEWQHSLQVGVAGIQQALEIAVEPRAKTTGKKAIIYDRGLLDGAAFLPGGVKDLENITGIDEATMLSRYDLVIHMAAMAIDAKNYKRSNKHRFEDEARARELEARTLGLAESSQPDNSHRHQAPSRRPSPRHSQEPYLNKCEKFNFSQI